MQFKLPRGGATTAGKSRKRVMVGVRQTPPFPGVTPQLVDCGIMCEYLKSGVPDAVRYRECTRSCEQSSDW